MFGWMFGWMFGYSAARLVPSPVVGAVIVVKRIRDSCFFPCGSGRGLEEQECELVAGEGTMATRPHQHLNPCGLLEKPSVRSRVKTFYRVLIG